MPKETFWLVVLALLEVMVQVSNSYNFYLFNFYVKFNIAMLFSRKKKFKQKLSQYFSLQLSNTNVTQDMNVQGYPYYCVKPMVHGLVACLAVLENVVSISQKLKMDSLRIKICNISLAMWLLWNVIEATKGIIYTVLQFKGPIIWYIYTSLV